MKDVIEITKQARKDLKRVPKHINKNFQIWSQLVESAGLSEVRKIKGYHDEPLSGNRKGQHSVRLSKSYRAFYVEYKDTDTNETEINIVSVIEVNKHEY